MSLNYFSKRVLGYGVFLLVLLNLIGLGLDYYLINTNVFKPYIVAKSKSLPENIILGSSRALTGICADSLTNWTGEEWYNLSIDDTPIETHALLYQMLVESENVPKRLVLQYDNSSISEKKGNLFDRDFQFMSLVLKPSSALRNYFSKSDWASIYYYVPMVKYFTFNTELLGAIIQSLRNRNYQHRFNEFGDYTYPQSSFRSNCKTEDQIKNVELQNAVLLSLIDDCKNNGTDLIIYTAPYRCKSVKLLNSHDEFLTYYNFSEIYKSDDFFSDEIHLNSFGRANFTNAFNDSLSFRNFHKQE